MSLLHQPENRDFNIKHVATSSISESDCTLNLTFLPRVIILQGGPSENTIYSFRLKKSR